MSEPILVDELTDEELKKLRRSAHIDRLELTEDQREALDKFQLLLPTQSQ